MAWSAPIHDRKRLVKGKIPHKYHNSKEQAKVALLPYTTNKGTARNKFYLELKKGPARAGPQSYNFI